MKGILHGKIDDMEVTLERAEAARLVLSEKIHTAMTPRHTIRIEP
jgi:hypothetical protein